MVLCTVLAVAALLSSCHGIYNDLEPCSQVWGTERNVY